MKINLIPEVKVEQQRVHKMNATVTTVATFVFFILAGIILVLALYNIFKTTQLALVKKDIDKTNQSLEAYKDLEQTVVSLETGLNNIKQIINGGPKWSKFFSELEKATPADVQFTSFNIKGSEVTAKLKGRNVQSIDRYLKSMNEYKVDDKNLFSNVEVSGYTDKGGNKVEFDSKFVIVGGVLW